MGSGSVPRSFPSSARAGLDRLPPSALQSANGRKLQILDTDLHFVSWQTPPQRHGVSRG